MRIKIEKINEVYFVTQTPDYFERLFGVKEKVDRYRWEGSVFARFPHIKVFYHESGRQLSWDSKLTIELNKQENKF